MLLFESMLVLLAVAIALLQLTKRFNIPYPTILAVAGVAIAASPWSPDFVFDPKLALALFIAPALLDAGFDLPPRTLLRHWLPITALVGVAVLLTTAAVAWVGHAYMDLAWPVAIALGAIVAPPDAAAATAVLARFELPRSSVTVLKGESLLNDAVALLVFSAAVSTIGRTDIAPQTHLGLLLAVPGGVLAGYASGHLFMLVSPMLAGTVSGTIAQFVATFAVWIIADQLHLSAILAVVSYAMTIARYSPERTSARDRVHAYSVWEVAVFLLNVLAFLLMGLQARSIIERLAGSNLGPSLLFAGSVFALVVVVRIVWVFLYNRSRYFIAAVQGAARPSLRQGLVVGWCGMRGLVTLAAALSLPITFPNRDLLVLTAFVVVIGTLVIQGLTLGTLVKFLRFEPDGSFDKELADTRALVLDAGLSHLKDRNDDASLRLKAIYTAEKRVSKAGNHPRQATRFDRLRRETIVHMRTKLAEIRRSGKIDDDVFHALEQELDTSELAVSPPENLDLAES